MIHQIRITQKSVLNNNDFQLSFPNFLQAKEEYERARMGLKPLESTPQPPPPLQQAQQLHSIEPVSLVSDMSTREPQPGHLE